MVWAFAGWLSAWRLWILRCRGWAENETSPSWPEKTSVCYCRGTQQHLQSLHTNFIAFRHTVRLREGFCSSFRQDQQGLAHLLERELKRVSQRLDQLSRHHHHQSHTPPLQDELRPHTGKAQQIPILYIICNLFQLLHYPKWLPTLYKPRGIHKSVQVMVWAPVTKLIREESLRCLFLPEIWICSQIQKGSNLVLHDIISLNRA